MEQKTLTEEEQKKLNAQLWNAAEKGNLSSVKGLLSKGANINYQFNGKEELELKKKKNS